MIIGKQSNQYGQGNQGQQSSGLGGLAQSLLGGGSQGGSGGSQGLSQQLGNFLGHGNKPYGQQSSGQSQQYGGGANQQGGGFLSNLLGNHGSVGSLGPYVANRLLTRVAGARAAATATELRVQWLESVFARRLFEQRTAITVSAVWPLSKPLVLRTVKQQLQPLELLWPK